MERGAFTPFDRPCLRLQRNILFIVVLLLFCVSCFGRWCRVSSQHHHPSSFLWAQIAQRTCTWRVSGVTRACRTWQCVWRPSVVTSLRMPPSFLSFDVSCLRSENNTIIAVISPQASCDRSNAFKNILFKYLYAVPSFIASSLFSFFLSNSKDDKKMYQI